MDEYRLARRVLMVEVSGGRVRGRLRLGWMDGVMVALENRGMTVEAAWPYAKDRKEWRPLVHNYVTKWVSSCRFAWPFAFSDRLLVLWWLSPGEGWYDVTWCGWNKLLKGRNYWNWRRQCHVYGLRGVCQMIVCVLSDLTWLPFLGGGREETHGIL